MKRLFAFVLALAMIFSLSVTAFAAEGQGSITISNATAGKAYNVFKVFDATYSEVKDKDGKVTSKAVSYTIEQYKNVESKTLNPVFVTLFGEDGTKDDPYFIYNANTKSVTKKEGVNDSDVIAHLQSTFFNVNPMAPEIDSDDILVLKDGFEYAAATQTPAANTATVTFNNLDYGYYMITSALGTTVTINSNTPDVSVIDKNQQPGTGFVKEVQTNVGAAGDPTWGNSNSANIGDRFSYKISFEATNYDGDKQIQYYQIHDEKGDAIWAEFNSFKVKVGDEVLDKGYYLSQGGVNTGNWRYLGEGWEAGLPEDDSHRNEADWYLVHLGYDQFRITIPWMTNHTVENVTNDAGEITAYSVKFNTGAVSRFESPVQVEIIYDVVLEANAAIGNTSHGNRFNKAYTSWTSAHETGSVPPVEVVTHTYGIGLLKDDGSTGINLAGAKFRIYRDADCKEPVSLIPTHVDGVYMIDSVGMPIADVSGTGKDASRDYIVNALKDNKALQDAYIADLEAYLNDKDGYSYTDEGNQIKQNNLVVSQINGKLAILGLKEGTYYLKEVEAPAGYNALTLPIELKAGEGIRPFVIWAAADGTVADIQSEDGIHTEYRLDLTHTVVHNSKGVELPSTGGEGTMMLITMGTMVAMVFAVLLITHKKMSIYED